MAAVHTRRRGCCCGCPEPDEGCACEVVVRFQVLFNQTGTTLPYDCSAVPIQWWHNACASGLGGGVGDTFNVPCDGVLVVRAPRYLCCEGQTYPEGVTPESFFHFQGASLELLCDESSLGVVAVGNPAYLDLAEALEFNPCPTGCRVEITFTYSDLPPTTLANMPLIAMIGQPNFSSYDVPGVDCEGCSDSGLATCINSFAPLLIPRIVDMTGVASCEDTTVDGGVFTTLGEIIWGGSVFISRACADDFSISRATNIGTWLQAGLKFRNEVEGGVCRTYALDWYLYAGASVSVTGGSPRCDAFTGRCVTSEKPWGDHTQNTLITSCCGGPNGWGCPATGISHSDPGWAFALANWMANKSTVSAPNTEVTDCGCAVGNLAARILPFLEQSNCPPC